jgi:hypothetical protein
MPERLFYQLVWTLPVKLKIKRQIDGDTVEELAEQREDAIEAVRFELLDLMEGGGIEAAAGLLLEFGLPEEMGEPVEKRMR